MPFHDKNKKKKETTVVPYPGPGHTMDERFERARARGEGIVKGGNPVKPSKADMRREDLENLERQRERVNRSRVSRGKSVIPKAKKYGGIA
jgi:hypothetical protein